ncbi:hypothetical protein CDL12_21423 [Handroanthus impetiginosus]|uniref:Uncharacterized protein n=1 Tax=Handroanthus impetiginosus TaxID=429701 RepID=A0A2G9GLE6_9LAMI|nr:hypothetical protein CDL12_21423 [Handroanthus impetiginosus]
MDDVVSSPPPSQDRPLLRRRNSISASIVVMPTKLTVLPHQRSASTATSSSDDLELLSIRPNSHSYTSLKDLLPSAAVNSPKPSSVHQTQPGSDICIRNRLVKQAAWAYLQPMATSPGSADGNFLHRLWPRVAAFFDFVRCNVMRALNWMLSVIQSSR